MSTLSPELEALIVERFSLTRIERALVFAVLAEPRASRTDVIVAMRPFAFAPNFGEPGQKSFDVTLSRVNGKLPPSARIVACREREDGVVVSGRLGRGCATFYTMSDAGRSHLLSLHNQQEAA